MYRYDEFDHAFVRERVAQFRDQVRPFFEPRIHLVHRVKLLLQWPGSDQPLHHFHGKIIVLPHREAPDHPHHFLDCLVIRLRPAALGGQHQPGLPVSRGNFHGDVHAGPRVQDQAVELSATGYKKAIELQVYDEYTAKIRESLGRLSAQKYPPERESRARERIGDRPPAAELVTEIIR